MHHHILTKHQNHYRGKFGLFPSIGYVKTMNNLMYPTGVKQINKRYRGELPQEERLSQMDNKSHSTEYPEEYSLEKFHAILDTIKFMQHRISTRLKYHSIWTAFNKFLIKFDRMPNTWEDRIYIFIAHLVDNKKQINTIKTYLSAIRQILLSDGVQLEEDKHLLSSLLKTSKLKNNSLFIRLPIRFGLLKLLLKTTDVIYGQKGQNYLRITLKAMFSMAYFGLLRVGELTNSPHQIKAENVHWTKNRTKLVVLLESSKTHTNTQKPQRVTIPGNEALKQFCPVKLLSQYFEIRDNDHNNPALFVLQGGQPISAYMFRNCLQKILHNIGVDSSLYNSHSFRQGRCVDLKKLGYSLQTIQKAGRWVSSAILNYLKIF